MSGLNDNDVESVAEYQESGSGDASNGQSEPRIAEVKIGLDEAKDYATVHEMWHLREKIINYSMWNRNGTLSGKTIATLRLVNKSFLVSVSKLLHRYNEPLFKLTLDKDKVPNGGGLEEEEVHEKMLDRFVAVVGRRTEPQLEEPYSTIRLKILEDFFEFENFDSLNNFFLRCGHGLMEIHLIIPWKGGSLPCYFPNLTLPILRKLTVKFTNKRLGAPPKDSMFVASSNNAALIIHSLLSRNESLENMVFLSNDRYDTTPVGLQYIVLPLSITKLDLDCLMRGCQLEILARSSLPRLTSLKLMVPNTVFPEGIFTQVLNNVRSTLRRLEINGIDHLGPPRLVNLISFPVMEKLEKLYTWSINFELDSNIGAVDDYFPKLELLGLHSQTRSMFDKWTTGPPAEFVESFELELVNENFPENTHGYNLPITLEEMQHVHSTFPNLSSLSLTLTGVQTCGLMFLFKEMRQLEVLVLFVAEAEMITDPDFWDSVFTGIPLESMGVLRQLPQAFLGRVDLRIDDLPSIRMLTNLVTVSLTAEITDQKLPRNGACPMISDLTFAFAFKKMPKLQTILLYNIEKASDETLNGWRDDGRFISYIN